MPTIAPISPERAVYDLPSLSGARFSPDGSRIVYVRSQVNRELGKSESQIWLAMADGSQRRQITHLGVSNVEPVWAPDGQSIVYVSRRDGDHPFAIALLSLAGGESRILTTHATAPSSLTFSPDGTTIAYVKSVDPQNPNETPRDPKAPAAVRVVKRIDYKQDGSGFVNDVRAQVFLLDFASGERRQLTRDAVDHLKPDWSPDGSTLAVILPHRNGQRARIGVVDVTSGGVVAYGVENGEVGLPSWSPDGKTVVYASDDHGSPHPGLATLDVASGTMKLVVPNPDFLIDSSLYATGTPIWLDATSVLVSGVRHGGSGLWVIDVATGEIVEKGHWQATHTGLSASSNRDAVVQTVTDLDGMIGLAVTTIASGEWTRTVLFNEAEAFFAQSPAAAWENVSIERAGFTIEGWLLKPADFDPARNYPLVIDVHGGPHGAYGYSLNTLAEIYATHGFIVLLVNPRGSTTYGRDFAESVLGDWGEGPWADLEAMLDQVLERPYIDRERTGVFGYSYGGYMASWILGHTDRFKAAVVGAPVFDLEAMFGTSDIGHSFVPEQNGGTPWEKREKLAAQSPSAFIHNAVTPTLIVHGEADERCPIGQGEQLFISLKKLGVETEFVRYPGGFHGFVSNGEPTHRLDVYERTLAWFKRFLGDPV